MDKKKNKNIQNAPPPSNMEEIDKFILSLSQRLFEKRNQTIFYEFAKASFDEYIQELKGLDKHALEDFLTKSDEMKCSFSKINFINLVKKIQDNCLCILEDYYKGDILSALTNLNKLLRKNTSNKLKDILANYFCLSSTLGKGIKLFRCVDWGCSKELPEVNCWHVPFNLRNKAFPSRFNFWGHICMYLSCSEENANKELGTPPNGMRRWTGTFSPLRNLQLLNLYIPTTEREISNYSCYDKFCLLLTYPFYILCLTKKKENDENDENEKQMPEEYYFPQLFLHLFFLSESNDQTKNDFPRFEGIIYNSLVDNEVANIVIPAKYEGRTPPTSGYSKYVKSLIKKIGEPFITK